MNKKIFVLNIGNYFPELTQLTFPTIERWAEKIDAEVLYITERNWPNWPLLTEKLQIYELGKNADWNILIDADILISPKIPDISFNNFSEKSVIAKDAYEADKQLKTDKIFTDDGRNIGISGCFVATSKTSHELWKPITDEMDLNTVCENILQERKIVDEYSISRNFAKNHYSLLPILPIFQYNLIHHLGAYDQEPDKILNSAKNWYKIHWN